MALITFVSYITCILNPNSCSSHPASFDCSGATPSPLCLPATLDLPPFLAYQGGSSTTTTGPWRPPSPSPAPSALPLLPPSSSLPPAVEQQWSGRGGARPGCVAALSVVGATGLGALLPSERRDRPGVGHPGGRRRCQAGNLVRAAARVPGRPPGCGAAQCHTVDKGITH
jgi:hypothetical protein